MKDFLDFAANVFGVNRETITQDTSYGSIPEWDSVMHLRLIMETEAKYGTSIPLDVIPQLQTLSDFIPFINITKAMLAEQPDRN